MDPYLLQHQTSFLGFSSRRTHPAAYNYLLGTAGGQAIINPEETLVALRRVLHLIKKVTFRGGRTLFVSTQPMLARLCRVIGEQSGQFYIARKWVPGLLTNWEKSRRHIHAKLKPDPVMQAAGKLKYSDLQKANYYRGVEHMTRPPDLIVRLDHTDLHGEAVKANVPLISVVDSDSSMKDVDYPIPANTKSLRFYHTVAYLLVRACKEGTSLRAELESYGVETELEDDSRTNARLARRGGGQRQERRGRKGRAAPAAGFKAPDKFGRVR